MKIAKYELKVVHKKKLILTMEDDVDSEELLKIFLKTQLKEEKEQSELLGIIAEKVSEESCTEQCESCQKYCPASEECMATDENVRCTKCEYLCEAFIHLHYLKFCILIFSWKKIPDVFCYTFRKYLFCYHFFCNHFFCSPFFLFIFFKYS